MPDLDALQELVSRTADPEYDRRRWHEDALRLILNPPVLENADGCGCPLLSAASGGSLSSVAELLKSPNWRTAEGLINDNILQVHNHPSPLSARVAVIQAAGQKQTSQNFASLIRHALQTYQAYWRLSADEPSHAFSSTDTNSRPAWRRPLPDRLGNIFDQLAVEVPGGYGNLLVHLVGSSTAAICNDWRPRVVHRVATWILLAVDDVNAPIPGILGQLTVSRLERGGGFVYPDPWTSGYLRLEPCFRQALAHAIAAVPLRTDRPAEFDLLYSLHLHLPDNLHFLPPLFGRSGEAALACAFRAARDGEPLDRQAAVTAQLATPGEYSLLNPVLGVLDKLQANEFRREVRRQRIHEVYVAKDQPEAGQEYDDGELRIIPLEDLRDAYTSLSRWARITRQVNRAIAKNGKRRLREKCDGPYIPSDLRRRKKHRDVARFEQDEDRYEADPLSKPQRREIFSGRGPQRIRLFADSGTGKTTLLMYWERKIALADNDLVPVRLDNLSDVPWLPDHDFFEAIAKQFIAELHEAHEVDEADERPREDQFPSQESIVQWLRIMRDRGKLVFLLDALDQMTELGPLNRWLNKAGGIEHCPVVITGRQHTESGQRGDIFHGDWETLRVDLFTDQQQRRFLLDRVLIDKLLPQEDDSRAVKQTKEHWQPLLGVPLLLRLMRDLARDGELDGLTNREQIYRRALIGHEAEPDGGHHEAVGLIGKGLTTVRGRDFDEDVEITDVVRFLASFAYSSVQREGFSGRIAESVHGPQFQRAKRIFKRDLREMDEDIELRKLLKILAQVNVLTKNTLVDRSEGFAWRHLSFCEYFVGVYLAEYLGEDDSPEERRNKVSAVVASTHDVQAAYQSARQGLSETASDEVEVSGTQEMEPPPRDQWGWVFRFALSRAHANHDAATLNHLARQLIAHGNPYVVFQAIEEDGIRLDDDLERLCRWLVHWTYKDHDYARAWTEGGERVPVELFEADTFRTMCQRRFRNSPSLAAAWAILEAACEDDRTRQAAEEIRDAFLREVVALQDNQTLIEFKNSFRPCPPLETDSLVFQMGASPGDDEAYEDEKPRHAVQLCSRFAMADFPVTNAVYEVFDPSHFWHRDGYSREDDQPAIYVSWYMARQFANWLSGGESLRRYRLPSEAEWDFALRATAQERFGLQRQLKGSGRSNLGSGTGIHNSLRPRVLELHRDDYGLLHINGEVAEWCEDRNETWNQQLREAENAKGANGQSDGKARSSSDPSRVVRSGSWRYDGGAHHLYGYIGFRLCIDEADS